MNVYFSYLHRMHRTDNKNNLVYAARMSNMRMEELNRRHSVIQNGSPLKSPQGSLVSHRSQMQAAAETDYPRSPRPEAKNGTGNRAGNNVIFAVV